MGAFKHVRRTAPPKKLLRGETVIHKRGDNARRMTYLSKLDKGLCKCLNPSDKIEVVPEFELIRINDAKRDNRERENQASPTGDSGKLGYQTDPSEGVRYTG